MTESAMSEEADPLYRPLGGIDAWGVAGTDEAAFADGVRRVASVTGEVADMVRRDLLLGAASRSAALDSFDGPAHVRANHQALLLARDADEVSETVIRRIHEVACKPQLTHRVLIDGHAHDHVLAAGDYKHHPNHWVTASGDWAATSPVSLVRSEMRTIVEEMAREAHVLARAGFVHDALIHAAPFEDGNGRVGRALAGGLVLRDASVPPLFSKGTGVLEAFLAAVEAFEAGCGAPDAPALARWRAESETADRLQSSLAPAVEATVERYMARPAGERRADLSGATVEPGLIRLPSGVTEALVVDAHPLDGGPVVVRAREAGLTLKAGAPLDPWLDRVVSILALRAAAEVADLEST